MEQREAAASGFADMAALSTLRELASDGALSAPPPLPPFLPQLSRRTVLFLFPALLLLAVGLCAVPGAAGQISSLVLSAILSGSISLGVIAFLCRARNDDERTPYYLEHLASTPAFASAAALAADLTTPMPTQLASSAPNDSGEESANASLVIREPLAAVSAATAGRAPRLYYLDNLKAALTAIVVAHHVIGAFAGGGSLGLSVGAYRHPLQPLLAPLQILNQSYFMSLFFFIAAYLSPPSLDRKGTREFLADRFQRLGVPFIVTLYLAGPLLGLAVSAGTIGRSPSWTLTPLSAWFLAWLLLFSFAYTLVGGTPADWAAARPSLTKLCAAGAALGILQALQVAYAPIFVMMPISFGSLPFDVVFFAAGIVARRGRWLEGPLASPAGLVAARAVVVLGAGAAFASAAVLYKSGGGLAFMPANDCGQPVDRGLNDLPPSFLGTLAGMSAFLGIFSVCTSVALLDAFRTHCNKRGPWATFFSEQAYAVYLLHPLVVLPVTCAAIAALRSLGGTISFDDSSVDSSSCLTSPESRAYESTTLAVAFAAVLTASFAIVYPLAYAVRAIPGSRAFL